MISADIVYFSPHLDDAIFSSAGHICNQTASGKKVLIVTIFTRGDEAHQAHYAARQGEDRSAVQKCGAESHHLGFFDAPFRNAFYHNLNTIFFGLHSDDYDTRATLRIEMEQVLMKSSAKAAFFPLAIGGHIDHRLCFDAAQELNFRGAVNFYEDRPYAFLPNNSRRRLKRLHVSKSDRTSDTHTLIRAARSAVAALKTVRDFNLKGDYSPSLGDAAVCLGRYLTGQRTESVSSTLQLTPIIEAITAPVYERALDAIASYPTQIAAITSTMERWQCCAERYALSLGHRHAERYWQAAGTAS